MSKICPVCERVYEDEHVFCAADGTALRHQGNGDDLIGSVIDDRYVITSLLGEGGMGRVYLGQHVHLPRKVALKVLHAKLTNDPAAVARFNREAMSTSRIEHDRVARVFDFGRMQGGATYLAMEYIPGRTLSDILDAEGALAPMRVAALVGQIADGLGAAHRLDIVHRDLKPDNILIMLDADGEECVKIVDFGIAKAIGPGDDTTLTAPGYVTGTPEYMSPEQLLGQTVDRRSDVFALGLVAFRTLTNTLPFAVPTPERGFSSVLIDTPRRLDGVAPMRQWPSGLQLVFDRVFCREPEGRYPTAVAFADALSKVIVEWEKTNAGVRGTPTIGVEGPPPQVANGSAVAATTASRAHPVAPPPMWRRWTVPAVAAIAVAAISWAALTRFDRESAGEPSAAKQDSLGAAVRGDGALARQSPVRDSVSRDTLRADSPVRGDAAARATTSAPTPTGAVRPPTVAPARAAPGVPSSPPPRATGRFAIALARIDSVRDALDALLLADEGPDTPVRANALAARVDMLLPDAPTAGDSARALLLKANLRRLAGDRARACSTLNEARPLAATAADRNSVRRNAELWGC